MPVYVSGGNNDWYIVSEVEKAKVEGGSKTRQSCKTDTARRTKGD